MNSGFPACRLALQTFTLLCLVSGRAEVSTNISGSVEKNPDSPSLSGPAPIPLYARLTGKTLLYPSMLPRLLDSLVADLRSEQTEAIAALESRFSTNGLMLVQDGPRFVRLFLQRQSVFATEPPLKGLELASASTGKPSAGMMDFSGAVVEGALRLYA